MTIIEILAGIVLAVLIILRFKYLHRDPEKAYRFGWASTILSTALVIWVFMHL